MKVTTEPISFEIEVKKLSSEIPEDYKKEFEEWLLNQPPYLSVGKHNEFFSYSVFAESDIEVSFCIKRIKTV